MCFLDFYSFANLIRACFVAFCPLSGLFLRPHRVNLPTRPSMYRVYLHTISFISLYFYCFLVCNKSCLDRPTTLGVMFGSDLWVGDVNIILAFGSCRTSVGLRFLALRVKE
jgi:hypothetical protein